MIQRIQSLYLLLAMVAIGLLFYFPVANYFSDMDCYRFSITEFTSLNPNVSSPFSKFFTFPLLINALALVILSGISIFYYKNRKLQINILNFNILFNIVLIVLLFFYTDKINKAIQISPEFAVGTFLPLISLLFFVLASRNIRKDEKLVKSADRLR